MLYAVLLSFVLLHLCAAGLLSGKSSGPTIKDFDRLERHLLATNRFTRGILPRETNENPINVTLGLAILNFNVDMAKDKLFVNAWIRESWTDYRLKWNPKNFGGINEARIPYYRVWHSDLSLYNSYGQQSLTPVAGESLAVVNSSGSVIFFRHVAIESLCRFLPDDTEQTCGLRFGSWTFDATMIDFHTESDDIDMGSYSADRQWTVLEAKAEREIQYYPCCKEPYGDIRFLLRFRKPQPAVGTPEE